MNAIQLDQLPYLCLKKIFQFLSLQDLVECRAVSRQFKFYAEEARVDELVVTKGRISYELLHSCRHCKNWYLTERAINFQNSIGPNAFSSVQSSPFKLDQLKFLHIHLENADLDFEILNRYFKALVHLEIKFKASSESKTLSQANLKTLNVRNYEHPSYVLKTPRLESLACNEIESIQVEHPERIKRLACEYRGENHMAKFKSLEVLEIVCINCDLTRIRLKDWTELKELNLQMKSYEKDNYKDFRSSLVDLLRQRTAAKRRELKLWLGEVLLNDVNQLPDYDTMDYQCLFMFKNYQHLRRGSYPEIDQVDFDYLMKLDGLELSTDFFDRFPAIEYVTAFGPVDRTDFEWFLSNAGAVRCLTLENSLLDQAFISSLPNISSRLINLTVKENSGLITDFNFICQLEQLHSFETDRQLGSLDLAAKAFRQLYELAFFSFRAGKEAVEIENFSCVKNNYNLSFQTVFNNKPCTEIFYRENLRWTELVAFYDQRRAASARRKKKGARIKRSKSKWV